MITDRPKGVLRTIFNRSDARKRFMNQCNQLYTTQPTATRTRRLLPQKRLRQMVSQATPSKYCRTAASGNVERETERSKPLFAGTLHVFSDFTNERYDLHFLFQGRFNLIKAFSRNFLFADASPLVPLSGCFSNGSTPTSNNCPLL